MSSIEIYALFYLFSIGTSPQKQVLHQILTTYLTDMVGGGGSTKGKGYVALHFSDRNQ